MSSYNILQLRFAKYILQPWYLTTLAVSEQLYDALTVWKLQSSLSVTLTSLAFFQNLVPTVKVGTYTAKSATYATLVAAVEAYADGFVATVAKYTPSGGGLAEQYSKTDGVSISAVDLTWSYAAALTAFGARAGVVPSSWGAKGLVVSSTCSTASGTGTGGGGGGGSGGGGSATVKVTFNVQATTILGGPWIFYSSCLLCTSNSQTRKYLFDRLGGRTSKLVPR